MRKTKLFKQVRLQKKFNENRERRFKKGLLQPHVSNLKRGKELSTKATNVAKKLDSKKFDPARSKKARRQVVQLKTGEFQIPQERKRIGHIQGKVRVETLAKNPGLTQKLWLTGAEMPWA